MNRRDFIKRGSIATALGLIAPSIILESCRKGSMQMSSFSQVKVTEGLFNTSLPVPASINASSISTITAQRTTASILKDKTTSVYGYHNGILGPFIKINNGDSVSLNFTNSLSEETNIHWHGLLVPQNMDGHPDNVVQAGGSYQYNFIVNQRAGMYWYHPHPNMKTARQAYMGLAGFFVVNDAEETALNLPSGDAELPIVIQDKRFHPDYSLNYSPNMIDVMNGYFGQYIVVNGVFSPVKEVATRWYRLRVLNGSTARVYNLAFSNSASFYVIGADAGLLSSAENVSSILLAPGERVDLLVNFSTYAVGTEIYLQSNSFSGANIQGDDSFKIMKFTVSHQYIDSFTPPTSLSVITPIPASQAIASRTWILGGMNMNGGMSGGMNMGGNSGNMKMLHTINGKTYQSNEILATVNSGTTEVWEIDNSNNTEIHPMHIHGVQFQVLSRTGGRNSLIASEKGWKDTVLLMANEKVKLIMTFPLHTGKFLLHCHNLEHEDNGMMVNFEIK